MILLKIYDMKFFLETISIFENEKFISFEINHEVMKIFTENQICISLFLLSDNVYSITIPVKFTVQSSHFFTYFERITADFIILDSMFEIIEDENVRNLPNSMEIERFYQERLQSQQSIVVNFTEECKKHLFKKFIKIPFIQRNFNSKEIVINNENSRAKFIIDKKHLSFFPISSTCTYFLSEKLIIKVYGASFEENCEIPVETTSDNHAVFKCSNEWIQTIDVIFDLISLVMFTLAETHLYVKLLVGKNTFYEFRIPLK